MVTENVNLFLCRTRLGFSFVYTEQYLGCICYHMDKRSLKQAFNLVSAQILFDCDFSATPHNKYLT